MAKHEIKRWDNGKVIYASDADTLREAVEAAIREKVSLYRADLSAANLRYANLSAADLSAADLSAANLSAADLSAANLSAADLSAANLSDADLRAANLSDADLRYANLSDETILQYGDNWKTYLGEVVPALCTAGGKALEVVATAWNCHLWQNCPMHVAFGADGPDTCPPLLRPRVDEFVRLFDAKLIPCPVKDLSAACATA